MTLKSLLCFARLQLHCHKCTPLAVSPVRFGVFTIEQLFDGYGLLTNLSVDFL